MSADILKIRPALKRLIVVRENQPNRWTVEGYELQGKRWQFTWLLLPAGPQGRAYRHAAELAQHSGIPMGEQPHGERIKLVAGILGAAA